MKTLRPVVLLLCLGLMATVQAARLSRIQVAVMIEAQADAIRFIGGPRFEVTVLMPKHMSPETFTPSSRDIIALRGAKAMFTLGLPFEKAFLPKVRETLPALRIIDCTGSMKFRHFDEAADGPQGEKDPHVWLSCQNMIEYAKVITPILAGLLPVEARDINLRGPVYCERLAELRKELQETLAPIKGSAFLVMHPAYGYFFDDFGLKQIPVEKNGKSPSTAELKAFLDTARAMGLTNILLSPVGNDRPARNAAAKLKGRTFTLNPLPGQNYADDLRKMAKTLLEVANQ